MSNYLGIDLGGTNIKFGIVNEDTIIYRGEIPTEVSKGTKSIIEKLSDIVAEAKRDYDILGAGIGVPGPVDRYNKDVIECKNLFWEDIPLAKMIEIETDVPVFVDNDANVAALAEYAFGHMKGHENSILLTLGTGVGGGAFISGELLRGHHGLGFEVGHMAIGTEGYKCNCGRRDCFETYSSATGLIRHYNATFGKNAYGTKEIFDLYSEGDKNAVEAVEWYNTYLAKGIVNLINLFDPSMIVLAGGVAKAFLLIEDDLNAKIDAEIFSDKLDRAKIQRSHLGNDSGILGSAMLAKNMSGK